MLIDLFSITSTSINLQFVNMIIGNWKERVRLYKVKINVKKLTIGATIGKLFSELIFILISSSLSFGVPDM